MYHLGLTGDYCLWESGDNANLTISCGPVVFNVHSFLVCPNSTFFAAAFSGGFKETITRQIELPDDHPTVVRRMLQFCYGILYSELGDLDDDPDVTSRPQAHAEMCVIAEKYGMEGLKRIAGMEFTSAMKTWEDETHTQTIPSFFTLVTWVYKGTPQPDRSLRDLLVKYAQKKWSLLAVVPGVKVALSENPDFAFDMINSKPLVAEAPPARSFKRYCQRCHSTSEWKPTCFKCLRCEQNELPS